MARPTTTVRVALIAFALAFGANCVLLGYVRYTTRTSALIDMRERVIEEAQTLRDVIGPASDGDGKRTILKEIGESDPEFLAGLFDGAGRQLAGNLPKSLPRAFVTGQTYEVIPLPASKDEQAGEAGLSALKLGRDRWLIAGRRLGEAQSLAHTLEQALVLAVLLALVLGSATGLAVAYYVNRRVRGMVRKIDGIGQGDFAVRLPGDGSRDGFSLLARRINLMLDRIDQLMRELRLVTDSLAHDLRSPIGRLRTKVERAIALKDEGQRGELLDSALLDADALTRMLTTVLEIGRAEAMTGTDRFERVDLASLARELVELYEPVADEKGVVIALDAEALPAFHGHRQLLTQAIGNLIDNALLHAADGHSIVVMARARPDGIAFGVADRGPGIAPGLQDEARRRFGVLDQARGTAGAGLGLSLAEAVAHLHHGKLMLEDNAPGLRAVLLLPAATNPA